MLSREAIAVVIGIIVLTTAGVFIGIHIHNSDAKPGPQPNCPKPGPHPNCPKPGPHPNCPKPGPHPNCPKPGPQPNCPKPNCPKPTFPCSCSKKKKGWGEYEVCQYGQQGVFTDLLCTNWTDKQLYNNETDKLVRFARMQ